MVRVTDTPALAMIHDALATIKAQLEAEHSTALLLAVSKLKPAAAVAEAYSPPSSHRHFAENYVQELILKHEALKDSCPEVRWHFIGALQSNKVKQLVEGVGAQLASIQSIDSVSKLERVVKVLEEQPSLPKPVELYLQVNVSGEASKHGFTSVEEVQAAFGKFEELQPCRNCHLVGLMTIGEPGHSERDFSRLQALKQQLQAWPVKLSMGMSEDYLEAVKQGSDCIRIGSLIFGSRS